MKSVTSAAQKETLTTGLIKPLLEQNSTAMSFRVVWRSSDEGREFAWKNILSHRVICDNVIRNLDGISLFISAITGCVSRPAKPKPPVITPAVAYWALLESADVNPRKIILQLQESVQGQAEVKLLQEPPLLQNAESMINTMCVVMKDHGNNYIKRRIAESYEELKNHVAVDLGQPAKIVVKNNALMPLATQAQVVWQFGKIFVDLSQ